MCLCVSEGTFWEAVKSEFPELLDRLGSQWHSHEPAEERRRELMAHFEQAVSILRTDGNVRQSPAATSAMVDELLADFLDALAEGTTPATLPTVSHAAALVRRAEELARIMTRKGDGQPLRVKDLSLGCGVPRRTLNHAFQTILGMGPVTYLRRLRLNHVRRALRQHRANHEPRNVTEVALEHGFWHLGRFAAQYRELFGTNPLESSRVHQPHRDASLRRQPTPR